MYSKSLNKISEENYDSNSSEDEWNYDSVKCTGTVPRNYVMVLNKIWNLQLVYFLKMRAFGGTDSK